MSNMRVSLCFCLPAPVDFLLFNSMVRLEFKEIPCHNEHLTIGIHVVGVSLHLCYHLRLKFPKWIISY